MPRSTIYEDSRTPESATSSRTLSRPSTRVKNDQKWDAQKDEIYRLYIEADNTLEATIQMIEETSGFKARKWKMKLKEWRFEKNLSKHDMEIIVAKARKRSRDESKNTIFFYGATQIRPERIENFKKRKTASDKYVVSSRSDTPENVTYRTPSPECYLAADLSFIDLNQSRGHFLITVILDFKGFVTVQDYDLWVTYGSGRGSVTPSVLDVQVQQTSGQALQDGMCPKSQSSTLRYFTNIINSRPIKISRD
ncbi:uncharacterized protein RCO7_04370 [Rhynchosporium graminicola]|uniref:Clr5 domain-containing protein n=1 Tax=Rhynchosporium graminicola TaxID=2792576 RepID=A0A1E1JRD5_9HELO|nr:uncharacterized protein RCO7_04370 [Rhynchosporium commune]